jgi:RHS repeat-associated protein
MSQSRRRALGQWVILSLKGPPGLDHVHRQTEPGRLHAGRPHRRVLYRAWGEVRHSSGGTPTDQRYTGQRDFGLGLYFYNARFYDSYLNRFASADTLIPNPGNVLDWDRFAAMRNNPLRYVDPTGHRTCTEKQAATGDETCDQNRTTTELVELITIYMAGKYWGIGIRMSS